MDRILNGFFAIEIHLPRVRRPHAWRSLLWLGVLGQRVSSFVYNLFGRRTLEQVRNPFDFVSVATNHQMRMF